ncbi:MAG: FHA domain-containing protein [Deltaproteobacteria bacterium]|nr:FHA domain-containing protein [Deltaproteobacteria bacterium]
MSEERKRDSGRFARDVDAQDGDAARGGVASRARNRTVLLTPETIGQVRASLAVEEEVEPSPDPVTDLLPPVSTGWDYPDNGAPRVVGREEHDAAPAAAAPAEDGAEEVRSGFDRNSRGGFNRPGLGQFGRPLRDAPSAPVAAPKGSRTPTSSEKRPPRSSGFEEERVISRPVRERPRSKIVGFLITFDTEEHGEVFELRSGRWLITSRPTEHGDYILVDDDSISPMHAVIRATAEGKVQVLDQLSEHGSGVLRVGSEAEEEISGTTVMVGHGDTVRFGGRRFVICLVPIAPKPA